MEEIEKEAGEGIANVKCAKTIKIVLSYTSIEPCMRHVHSPDTNRNPGHNCLVVQLAITLPGVIGPPQPSLAGGAMM